MAMDYVEIGKNIRRAREDKGLKQAQLAELIGRSSQHISHIECARTQVGLDTLVLIANALGVPSDSLLGENVEASWPYILRRELYEATKDFTPTQLALCIDLCHALNKHLSSGHGD